MNPAERCLTVAIMAIVLACLCIRMVGQFVAGHAVQLFCASKSFLRRRPTERRHRP